MIGPRSKEEVAEVARGLLREIENGELKLTADFARWDYECVPVFISENGWRFGVFNDAGQWDYLEFVTSDEGVTIGFDWMWDNANDLANWRPENIENWPRAK